MGCDIHVFVERFDREKNKWFAADNWIKNNNGDVGVPYDERIYSGRNYNLFAILANVRNGRGFAGIKTGEGFDPIDEPRGLPVDVTREVRAEMDGWGDDGHSHSYVGLRELLEYDFDGKAVKQYGVISSKDYEAWSKNRGEPSVYWGASFGPEEITLDEAKYLRSVANGQDFTGKNVNVRVSWVQSYRDAVGKDSEFFTKTMPRMLELSQTNYREDVRLVFCFDN